MYIDDWLAGTSAQDINWRLPGRVRGTECRLAIGWYKYRIKIGNLLDFCLAGKKADGSVGIFPGDSL